MTTVIIPAHNEAAVLANTLQALLADAQPDEFDVIVACNGCTDGTGDIARNFQGGRPDVRVIDVDDASKIAALNAALEASDRGPWVFLDADVLLSAAAVRQLHRALHADDVLAASTQLQIHDAESSLLSRSYHRFWQRLPSIQQGLAGRGVYALSEKGLARLGTFPYVVADDRYVHLLFGPGDRRTIAAASTVEAAHTARDLIKRKTRVFAGNNAIDHQFAEVDDGSWIDVVRADPRSLVDLPAYLVINLVSKVKARQMRDGITWTRDESTR